MADSTALAGGARVAHVSEGGAPRRGRFDPIAAAAALFFVLHLLGEKAETRAFPGLCRLLRDAEAADLVL